MFAASFWRNNFCWFSARSRNAAFWTWTNLLNKLGYFAAFFGQFSEYRPSQGQFNNIFSTILLCKKNCWRILWKCKTHIFFSLHLQFFLREMSNVAVCLLFSVCAPFSTLTSFEIIILLSPDRRRTANVNPFGVRSNRVLKFICYSNSALWRIINVTWKSNGSAQKLRHGQTHSFDQAKNLNSPRASIFSK